MTHLSHIPWHINRAYYPFIEKQTFLIQRGGPQDLTDYFRRQCGRLVGIYRQMEGVSVVRLQGEYIFRLTLCLFNMIKRCVSSSVMDG